MYEQIRYEVNDPVGLITLNRPERLNAWTTRMGAEVRHAVAAAERDPRVVGIVITGEGRGFCSGADLSDLAAISNGQGPAKPPPELEADPGDPTVGPSFRGPHSYLLSVRKPVIAAINGPCAGMAVPIVLCCDLRFASDRAVFVTAFSQRGLIAEWGSSWLLPRLIGPSAALDLLWSSRRIGAEEAWRMGLVNRVVPHDQLMEAVRGYVSQLAAECSPTSLAIMKRQVYRDLCSSLHEAEEESFRLMLESFGRPDFREGVAAFLEKRPARFRRLPDAEPAPERRKAGEEAR